MLDMRFRPFQVARLFGIPVMIDYSWVPMALLHVWLLAQFWLPMQVNPPLPMWQNLVMGLVITTLFFGSVLGHELAHALVARLEGIKIHDIQLHIFGGWARLVGEPKTAMAEFRVAVAGPVASFLLAIFFWLCLFTVQEFSDGVLLDRALAAGFFYLAAANLLLAMFNLLPGLPLDGGRALRAYLWHKRGDILSATRTMSRMGVGIAYMLISYGMFLIGYGVFRGTFWQDFVVAVWLMVVGVFLKTAAESDYRNRQLRASESAAPNQRELVIAPGTVGEVMTTPAICVAPELRVSEFVDRVLSKNRLAIFAVAHEGRLHGILSLVRLRELPSESWEKTFVRDVMLPINDELFVTARASIEHAQHKLDSNQLGFLAVIDQDGFLVGYLNGGDLKAST